MAGLYVIKIVVILKVPLFIAAPSSCIHNCLLGVHCSARTKVFTGKIAMDEPCSVNSPRRVLSFSKNRRANVSFPDSDSRASSSTGFGVSGEHGPKPSEVYGFVGSITTVVATVIFIIWAYVPDYWLHSIGIYYYPSRYWALAVPTFVMMTVVLAIGLYIGLNFMATPPPTSLSTMFDEFSREQLSSILSIDDDELPIEPISDIGIDQINSIMFDNLNMNPA